MNAIALIVTLSLLSVFFKFIIKEISHDDFKNYDQDGK